MEPIYACAKSNCLVQPRCSQVVSGAGLRHYHHSRAYLVFDSGQPRRIVKAIPIDRENGSYMSDAGGWVHRWELLK